MFKDYLFYIFPAVEIGKVNIAIVNRWKWIANNKLELLDDEDLLNFLNHNAIKLFKPGLYQQFENNLLTSEELKLDFLEAGFEESKDLINHINKLYPYNYVD